MDNFVGKVVSNVKIEKQLFKGSNKVFIGTDEKTSEKMVIKIIDIKDADGLVQKTMEAESKIGLILSKKCLFLVKTHSIIYEPDFIYMIMEFCPEGNLAHEIEKRIKQNKPFPDDVVLEITFQLGKAVEVLHDAGVIHRDLKPENIFIVKNEETEIFLKIGDFGISRVIDCTRKNTTLVMATIGYAPPEVLNGEEYSKAGDIYSLGLIILEIIDLFHPFHNEKRTMQTGRVFTGQTNQARPGLSPLQSSLRALALQMVNVDFGQRPVIGAVLAFPPIAGLLCRAYEKCVALSLEVNLLRKQLSCVDRPQIPPPSPRKPTQTRTGTSPPVPVPATPTAKKLAPQVDVDFPLIFLPGEVGGYVINLGKKLLWKRKRKITFYVNPEINEGVYKIVIKGNTNGNSWCIGLAAGKNLEKVPFEGNLNNMNSGACCLWGGALYSGEQRVCKEDFFSYNHEITLGLELDASTHIAYFFANGKQIPHCVINVQQAAHFGISGWASDSTIELLSLTKLTTATTNPFLKCSQFLWKKL